jgi:exosortase B
VTPDNLKLSPTVHNEATVLRQREKNMTTVAHPAPADDSANLRWALALGLFVAMFTPLYIRASGALWEREEHAHGPMILAIALYLAWTLRDKLVQLAPPRTSWPGWCLLGLGSVSVLLGRLVDFSILEFASQMFGAAGLLWLTGGGAAIRRAWFPLLFLVFMIPLPGVFVDSVTSVLKQWVSVAAEQLLLLSGYPVGREGVMLVVGPYQLLVADACSGLHSMFTLTAMGMLFMYLKQRKGFWHNAIMLLAILPVAFAANIIRVMVLVLITYHLGDEAGQGFLHGMAGIFLVVIALLTLIAIDKAIEVIRR